MYSLIQEFEFLKFKLLAKAQRNLYRYKDIYGSDGLGVCLYESIKILDSYK